MFPEWAFKHSINLIEVALVAMDKQLHPYKIENKNRYSPQGKEIIFRDPEDVLNILYFLLLPEDFDSGYKT